MQPQSTAAPESFYEAGQWKPKLEGNQQASHTHDSKEEAAAK
ncbi:DUF2188 domain-containing protein [Amycolatopsis sp. NPDC023774]